MPHTLTELVMGTSPIIVPDTKGFWEGTLDDELRIQVCNSCNNKQLPWQACCANCLSRDLSYQPAKGTGTIFSFTVVHHAFHPNFAGAVPYVIADVQLDEGPIMTSAVTGIAPDQVRIGMPVEVWFDEPVEDAFHERLALPKFKPRN